jgi:carbamoyltransferase
MNQLLRRLAVRCFLPLSWRLSRRRVASSLERFSQVEADGAWQMLQALRGVDDPQFRVELFNNALEEVHHAALFARVARSYADTLAPYAHRERRQLFDPHAGLAAFEAVHFVGEVDVYDQFLTYAAASPYEDIKATFLQIRGDEADHQRLAYDQLAKMLGSEETLRRMIRAVRRARAYEQWGRLLQGVGGAMSTTLSAALYGALGSLLFLPCRRRLRFVPAPARPATANPAGGATMPAATTTMPAGPRQTAAMLATCPEERNGPVASRTGGGTVLGISAFYHDAAAALVADGEVVATAAEERFTRQKHDANFPHRAIAFCLEQAGVTAQDLDAVVFYEDPHAKFSRVLTATLAGFPASRRPFTAATRQWLGKKLWVKDAVSAALDIPPSKVHFLPHHLSHAAGAFLGAPFAEAAILTLDAVGEWDCTALAVGSSEPAPAVRVLETIPYPHSLGLVYSAFTAFLGFRPNAGECSTMALAAFGRPTYADAVREVLRPAPDGTYRVDDRFFNFLSSDGALFARPFLDRFGPRRSFKAPLSFDALPSTGAEASPATADERRYADIAASVQLVLEEAILGLARRLHQLTGARHLCLAGGVALNAVANRRLLQESPFADVFIPPDPGDGGGALGAALYHAQCLQGAPRRRVLTPFLGMACDSAADVRMLREIDPAAWAPYLQPGVKGIGQAQLTHREYGDFDDLVAEVVRDLTAGRIVGWVQGRFEAGPRALGNRSLLVDPSNLTAVRRLARKVKSRAAFRPYALSVAEEDAGRLFDFGGRVPWPARWMQMVARVRGEEADRVRGALHADGTIRPQVCAAADNPRFHRLLRAFGQSRGLAALLNTSFNESGYPMVASPAEALLVFARTEMDTLVFEDCLVRKNFHETPLLRDAEAPQGAGNAAAGQ